MKILISDDQSVFRNQLKKDLEAAGHVVIETEDGWDALRILGSVEVDLAIVDIDMPKLNGLSLIRLCSNSDNRIVRNMKFIVVTANGGIWNKGIAWANNAIATISKPYSLEHLLTQVKRTI